MHDVILKRREALAKCRAAANSLYTGIDGRNIDEQWHKKNKRIIGMKIGFHTDAFNSAYWSFDKCLAWAQRNKVQVRWEPV